MVHTFTKLQKCYIPVKRVLDFLCCLPVCIFLLPFMGIFALMVKLDSPGPVFFTQTRVGKDKKLFKIWKFRTMRADTPGDIPTHLLTNSADCITRFGRWARKCSVDELPQLYQVLFGMLSLCGPRPALWNQDDLIGERDKYGANRVKPGITGWAQINGRDTITIPEKARLDGEYVRNFGFRMDVRCLLGTVACVLRGTGVAEGSADMLEKENVLK